MEYLSNCTLNLFETIIVQNCLYIRIHAGTHTHVCMAAHVLGGKLRYFSFLCYSLSTISSFSMIGALSLHQVGKPVDCTKQFMVHSSVAVHNAFSTGVTLKKCKNLCNPGSSPVSSSEVNYSLPLNNFLFFPMVSFIMLDPDCTIFVWFFFN